MTDEATPPASPHPTPAGSDLAPPIASPIAPPIAPDAPVPPAAPEAVVAGPAWRPNFVFLAVVSIVSLVADLGTKGWAQARLVHKWHHIGVIEPFFGFTLAENRGGAWGLLQDQPETIRRPFFLGISVVAIIFIVSLYRKLTRDQLALRWGLPLVLGGALGNLVNRIQLNYVVDFIDVRARWGGREHAWPTFNVADVVIVVGVGLMAVDMFSSRRPPVPAAAVGVEVPSAPSDREVAPPSSTAAAPPASSAAPSSSTAAEPPSPSPASTVAGIEAPRET